MKLPEMKALYVGVLAVSMSTGALAGTVTSDGPDVVIATTGGFKAKTADGNFAFKLGGRMMWDYDYVSGVYTRNNTDAQKDAHGHNLRRARLELSGKAYKHWEYIFTVNVPGGGRDSTAASAFNDLGISYTGWDGHKLFVGKGKEPFGLEEQTSSKSITSIERSMMWDATDSDSQTAWGVRYDGWADMFTWSLGLFDQGYVDAGSGSADYAMTGRFTVAPIAEAGNVLHFGAAYRMVPEGNAADSDLFDLSPGVSELANHGTADNKFEEDLAAATSAVESDSQYGLEALWIGGPFSLQAEYFHRDIEYDRQKTAVADEEVTGWYLYGSWVLTGESRGYKAGKKGAVADIVKPKGKDGAWEIFARYDTIEADQAGAVTDPEVDAITLGANWYVNKNVKLAMNWTTVEIDGFTQNYTAGQDDDGDALLFRAQYGF